MPELQVIDAQQRQASVDVAADKPSVKAKFRKAASWLVGFQASKVSEVEDDKVVVMDRLGEGFTSIVCKVKYKGQERAQAWLHC